LTTSFSQTLTTTTFAVSVSACFPFLCSFQGSG